MSEDILRGLLMEMTESDFAEFNDPPEWKSSLKHRIAMKHIFARYERNVRILRESKSGIVPAVNRYKPRHGLKKRLVIAILIVVLMTLLVGWINVFFSEKFQGRVYRESTLIKAVDTENCPQTIEHPYTLDYVPVGFELIDFTGDSYMWYTYYMEPETKRSLTIRQNVKSTYTTHFNTERHRLEEVEIKNTTGLFMDASVDNITYSGITWDNGDYIIDIMGHFTKDELLHLVEINKF